MRHKKSLAKLSNIFLCLLVMCQIFRLQLYLKMKIRLGKCKE